nr:Biomphalaria glabrata protein SREK1IP1-like; transcript variant X2 [Biomphalaria glabrata]
MRHRPASFRAHCLPSHTPTQLKGDNAVVTLNKKKSGFGWKELKKKFVDLHLKLNQSQEYCNVSFLFSTNVKTQVQLNANCPGTLTR